MKWMPAGMRTARKKRKGKPINEFYSPSPNTLRLVAGRQASGEPCGALAKQGNRLRKNEPPAA